MGTAQGRDVCTLKRDELALGQALRRPECSEPVWMGELLVILEVSTASGL